jgi:hypothetical protein
MEKSNLYRRYLRMMCRTAFWDRFGTLATTNSLAEDDDMVDLLINGGE